MGQVKDRRSVARHRLLIYEGIAHRMRTTPFLIGGLTLILFVLGWLSTQEFMQAADTSLLQMIWANNVYLIIILFVSAATYVFAFVSGRFSYVEPQAKFLHIQAGLLAINISYRRLTQVRLSQVGTQFPAGSVRGADLDLIEPLLGVPCTLVDMRSWPWPGYNWLRRLWSKFMFSGEGVALMLIVPDAMVLNQQIDSRVTLLQAQGKKSQYLDPLERAVQAQKRGRR